MNRKTQNLTAAFLTAVTLLLNSNVLTPVRAAEEEKATTTVARASKPYTGVLIDARHLHSLLRSPSAAVYGPDAISGKVYPDVAHLPTASELQENGIVRYFRSETQAKRGVVGDNPLIIKAVAVIGYGKDGVTIREEDAAKLRELDKTLQFTKSWNVGFLVGADQ